MNENTALIPASSQEMTEDELKLALSLKFNFDRDYVWELLTKYGIDLTGRKTGSLLEQTCAQMLYPGSAMVIDLIVTCVQYKLKGKNVKNLLKWGIISITAALAAVPAWNYNQDIFENWAQTQGYSAEGIALMGSVGAGIAEGPTQYLVAALVETLWDRVEACLKRAQPQRDNTSWGEWMCKKSFEFTSSLTFGAIPGFVWSYVDYKCEQWLGFPQAPLPGRIAADNLSSLIVATAVKECNHGYAKFVEKTTPFIESASKKINSSCSSFWKKAGNHNDDKSKDDLGNGNLSKLN